MKTAAIVVLCLFGALLTEANEYCHYKTPMENFDMNRFMGKWYWSLETPNVYSGRGDRCPITEMHERDNGTIAYILKYIHVGASEFTVKEGNMFRCSNSRTDGKLVAEMPTDNGYWEANWWILGTDYNNYAATYACWFSHDGSYRSWNMGWCREKVCTQEHKDAIKTIFQEHEVDVNTLEDVPQAECPEA